MTYFGLKCLACITMLLDHLSFVCPVYFDWLDLLCGDGYRVPFFRLIGRLAFPIFAFLIVNGLNHTRDLKKYALRLAFLALLSEIPFNLMVSRKPVYFGSTNVVFTLLIGLICLSLWRIYKQKVRFCWLFSAVTLLLGCVASVCLGSDYSFIGVLTVCLFGVFDRNRPTHRLALTTLLFLLFSWKSVGVLIGTWLSETFGFDLFAVPIVGKLFAGDIWPLWVRLFSLVSLIPIFLYNDKKGLAWVGERGKRICAYILNGFYPVHMFLIYWFFMR